MAHTTITDFDAAYGNADAIENSASYPPRWESLSTAFRENLATAGRVEIDVQYGQLPRNTLDLFRPAEDSRGLVVFVHGGYWKAFGPEFWSYLAEGPLAHGYTVVMPRYTLCPDARISDITVEIGAAVKLAAEMAGGPIRLSGHSAGGHLVTRLVSETTPLDPSVHTRIAHTLTISGVHDLRPLRRTAMNAALHIDDAEARTESPVLLEPLADQKLTCWVGGNELPEFVRQNSALASAWLGLGASVRAVEEPGKHHFDVIDGLADPDSALTTALLGS